MLLTLLLFQVIHIISIAIERPRGGEKTVGTVVSVSIHVHNI